MSLDIHTQGAEHGIVRSRGPVSGRLAKSAVSFLRFCGPIALMLVLWGGCSRAGLLNPGLVPPPSAVLANMMRLLHSEDGAMPVLLWHTLVSFGRIIAGYALAAVLCTGLGLLMGINPTVHAFFDSI